MLLGTSVNPAKLNDSFGMWKVFNLSKFQASIPALFHLGKMNDWLGMSKPPLFITAQLKPVVWTMDWNDLIRIVSILRVMWQVSITRLEKHYRWRYPILGNMGSPELWTCERLRESISQSHTELVMFGCFQHHLEIIRFAVRRYSTAAA